MRVIGGRRHLQADQWEEIGRQSAVPEKKKILNKTFSRYKPRPLGIKTTKLTKGDHKDTTAVVYSPITFANVFKNFSLPVSEDFVSAVSARDVNGDGKEDAERRQEPKPEAENSCLRSDIPFDSNGLSQVAETAETELPEIEQEEFSEAVSALVAIDTETEPFDSKRGIGPRNARMIGLSLTWDGAEKTDYVTDPEAWPFFMPEPDQTVIFHNAKFDLGVLERTGLTAPAKWEDTLIAAHLLDETGEDAKIADNWGDTK